MYTFKEDSWLHNGVEDIWNLVYIKKGSLFPEHTGLISRFSGIWVCKKGYSWKHSAYFGKNLKETTKKLKAKIIK